MIRKAMLLLFIAVLAVVVATPVSAEGPTFDPAIYADGEVWATKAVGPIPGPNENNMQSYDKLFVITNGVDGQMPVGEAAPGNPAYNGGRWYTHTVTWNVAPELVTSYAQLHDLEMSGDVTVTAGSPSGGPPPFFGCPLLPVK